MQTGDRVVKIDDGRAVPLGTRGMVEWMAGVWVAVAWDNGDKCVVRSDGVKVVEEVRDEASTRF